MHSNKKNYRDSKKVIGCQDKGDSRMTAQRVIWALEITLSDTIIHSIINLLKPIKYTIPRVNYNINYGF